MIKFIRSHEDSYIDERYPLSNYGLNNILLIKKEIVDSSTIYNSRILMKFNLSELQNLINSNKISDPTYYLNLYSAGSYHVNLNSDIKIYPVSGSWNNGTGVNIENEYLQEEDGASWLYRNNYDELNLTWSFDNLETDVTYSYQTNKGGGTWYDNLEASQSINYNEDDLLDIRVNVTDIVNSWLTGSISNNGFLIKKSEENESNSINYNEISFFSKDSTTVYYPKLEVIEDDSIYITGSRLYNFDERYRLYTSNLKNEYSSKSKEKITISCNELYPTKTYQMALTSSYNEIQMPENSYYEVIRKDVGDNIISKSEGTKISSTESENYFYFDFSNLNKHYNYQFRYVLESDSGNIVKYYYDDKIFTVR